MRPALALATVILCLAQPLTAADAPLKDAIVGEWTIVKLRDGKPTDTPGGTIEIRKDGTYKWTYFGQPREGKWDLKGADLHLGIGGGGAIVWPKLKAEGEKITREVFKGMT